MHVTSSGTLNTHTHTDTHTHTHTGWLTVGPEITSSNFSKELYSSFFTGTDGFLMGQIDEIESKRPKTPPPRGGGRGSGRGRGATSGPGRGRGRGSGF